MPKGVYLQLGGQELEDVINLVLESARQHLVSLVEHEHPDGVGTQGATAQHIVHAAGRANDNMNTTLQDPGVLADAGAANTCVAFHLK